MDGVKNDTIKHENNKKKENIPNFHTGRLSFFVNAKKKWFLLVEKKEIVNRTVKKIIAKSSRVDIEKSLTRAKNSKPIILRLWIKCENLIPLFLIPFIYLL